MTPKTLDELYEEPKKWTGKPSKAVEAAMAVQTLTVLNPVLTANWPTTSTWTVPTWITQSIENTADNAAFVTSWLADEADTDDAWYGAADSIKTFK